MAIVRYFRFLFVCLIDCFFMKKKNVNMIFDLDLGTKEKVLPHGIDM